MPQISCQAIVEQLSRSWPGAWRLKDGGVSTELHAHPIGGELNALAKGEAANLPYFRTGGDVAWITVAPNANALRSTIHALRAWVIPSFGWEDTTRAIVQPNDYAGPLAPHLICVSPVGYYRWWSKQQATETKVVNKLRLWRELQSARPAFAFQRQPSLFELRQQFQLALATFDRDLADQAIRAINGRQLDTATNTMFMRTLAHDHFREYREIVEDSSLPELLELRTPHVVRLSIVRAFYEVYLRQPEELGNMVAAKMVYMEKVHPSIASLLTVCKAGDDETTDRCLEYYKSSIVVPSQKHEPESTAATFFTGLRRSDWRGIQESGIALADGPIEDIPESLRSTLRTILAQSLDHWPNPMLAAKLDLKGGLSATPQSWQDFLVRLRTREWESARRFLQMPDRRHIDPGDPVMVRGVLDTIEEMFTDPLVSGDIVGMDFLRQSLPALIEDLVGDPEFPRPGLAVGYLALLQLWAQHRLGSVQPADSNVLLALAQGSMCTPSNVDAEVGQILRQWWTARPVRALLPFLLEAIELLSECSADQGFVQSLWIDGADFLLRSAMEIASGERQLWRKLGARLTFSLEVLDQYFPEPKEEAEGTDPLVGMRLRKIAIVSLHEKAASLAAEIIRARTGAEVIVVDELVAGKATQSACSADVILMVWAATKHAVFRAFDDVRDKLAYVQGKGSGSIVLALERWVLHQDALRP